MKIMKVVFVKLFFLVGLALSAEHHEMEIIRLIDKVKKVPPEERYKVMNELKMHLRELNRKEREEAIRKIYEELSAGSRQQHEREDIEGKVGESERHGIEREEEHGIEEKHDRVYEKIENKKAEEEDKDHDHRIDDDEYGKEHRLNPL
jgi:biotin-(acetyl-CoA carboxylase) ligase